jgi:hypothetical protein
MRKRRREEDEKNEGIRSFEQKNWRSAEGKNGDAEGYRRKISELVEEG